MSLRTRLGKYVISIAACVLFYLVFSPSTFGQDAPPPACEWVMQKIASGAAQPSDFANVPESITCFWELAPQLRAQVMDTALRTLAPLQKSTPIVQTGATSGSNGTTSAVSKPSTPIASLATEYGGITSSTSNQTVTLQSTLAGVPSALVAHGIVPYCWSPVVLIPGCFKQKDLQTLNKFGLGLTFNTSGTSQTVNGTASPSQGTAQQASLSNASNRAPSFSGFFTKVALIQGTYKLPSKGPPGTPTLKARQELDQAFADPSTQHGILQTDVWNNLSTWMTDCVIKNFTRANLSAQTGEKYDKAKATSYFNKYYRQIVAILFDGTPADCSQNAPDVAAMPDPGKRIKDIPQTQLIERVTTYMASASIFESQLNQMLEAAASPALSFEYDFNKPISQPTTSTLKLIGSKGFGPTICNKSQGKATNAETTSADTDTAGVKRFTATLNIAGSLYNSPPANVPGAGVFRAFQAGTELDTAICNQSKLWIASYLGNATIGLTYYYQDQISPSILKITPGEPLSGITVTGLDPSTSSVFSKKGPISFVQIKYGLGVGKNVKFPIAFSWSNRTDLITHALWSAQFGVSYDFSSLLGSK